MNEILQSRYGNAIRKTLIVLVILCVLSLAADLYYAEKAYICAEYPMLAGEVD